MSVAKSSPAATTVTGVALVAVGCLAFSSAGYFTRLIDVDTWSLLAWRGIFGSAGLLVVLLLVDGIGGVRRLLQPGPAGTLLVAVSAVAMIAFINALRLTSVAHVSVIYATVPLVTAALGWIFLKEQPTRSASFTMVVALLGVVIMVGFGAKGSWTGDLLAVAMTVCMGFMIVIPRRFQQVSALQTICLASLVSGLISLSLAPPHAVPARTLGLLCCFGLVNSAAGFALFAAGAKLLPAVESALISAIELPVAPLWVWLAFGEAPNASTLVGGSLVVLVVVAHILTSHPPVAA